MSEVSGVTPSASGAETGLALSGPVSGVLLRGEGAQVTVGTYTVDLSDLMAVGESPLAESTYSQRSAAAEVLGKTVSYQATADSQPISGQVTAVTQRDGKAYVTFGEHTVPLEDVQVVDQDVAPYSAEDLERASRMYGEQVLFTPAGQDTPEVGVVEGVRLESDGIYVVVGDHTIPLSQVTLN